MDKVIMYRKLIVVLLSVTAIQFVNSQEPVVPIPNTKNEPVIKDEKPVVKPTEPDSEDSIGLMPNKFIRNKVSSLKINEQVYIRPNSVVVDNFKRCFLLPENLTSLNKSDDKSILLKRDALGFHIYLEEGFSHQWIAEDIDLSQKNSKTSLIVVKSVNVKN